MPSSQPANSPIISNSLEESQQSPSHSSQDQPDQEPKSPSTPTDPAGERSDALARSSGFAADPEPKAPNPVEVPIPVIAFISPMMKVGDLKLI